MEHINFQNIGVSELTQKEMVKTDGGIIAFLVGAALGFFVTIILVGHHS